MVSARQIINLERGKQMTYMEKIKEAQKRKIDIPTEFADGRSRVGIYKFFKIKDNDIYCFYVGKSTDIAYRLLGSSDGHTYICILILIVKILYLLKLPNI